MWIILFMNKDGTDQRGNLFVADVRLLSASDFFLKLPLGGAKVYTVVLCFMGMTLFYHNGKSAKSWLIIDAEVKTL